MKKSFKKYCKTRLVDDLRLILVPSAIITINLLWKVFLSCVTCKTQSTLTGTNYKLTIEFFTGFHELVSLIRATDLFHWLHLIITDSLRAKKQQQQQQKQN